MTPCSSGNSPTSGHQIGFASSAPRAAWTGSAPTSAQWWRQGLQPAGPIALRPELGLERHLIQRRNPRFQPVFRSKSRNACVGEPRPQYPFIAGDDGGAVVVRLDIGDKREPRCGGASGVRSAK